MNEYNFFADLLNKYSQLTPWVQVVIGLGFFGVAVSIAYFMKESLAVIMKPFERNHKAAASENNNDLLRIEKTE